MYYIIFYPKYILQVKLVKMISIQIVLQLQFSFCQGKTLICVYIENSLKLPDKEMFKIRFVIPIGWLFIKKFTFALLNSRCILLYR
jgi:hypothetical protein